MTTSNRGWLLLVLALVLSAAGCADGSIDDPDGPSSVLQIQNLDTPDVTCGDQGFCSADPGLQCSTNSECVVDQNDFGPCVFDEVTPEIDVWTGTVMNSPTSEGGATSPFNDLTLDGVTLAYNWLGDPCVTPTRFVGIGINVPANGTASFDFNPIAQSDLGNPCILNNTAEVTLTFVATSLSGDTVTETITRQLNVEGCE